MELRPGYKQTEVGVIPDDWGVTLLGTLIGSLEAGVSVNSLDKDVSGEDTSILKTSCVIGGKFLPGERKTIAARDIHRAKLNPCKDTIVISRMNTPALVGECGYVDRNYPNLFLPDRLWMTRHDSRIAHCVRWLAQLLSSRSFNQVIKDSATGTSGSMKNISKGSLLAVRIPLPPTKAEQEAIAEALSDADALIESLEQLLAKKRQIKQGAMQELLTGKKRLSGFSGEWEAKLLGNTATLKARIGWQGLTAAEYLDSGDFYLVTGTEFKDGYIDWYNCHYVDATRYKQDKYIQLKEHDVLVTKDGTIGKVALVMNLPRPATLNSGVFVIRPVEDAFHPAFFYYLLCSRVFAEFLVQLSAGSTINHLYQKDFVSFVYKTPTTIGEQSAIAAILSDMDAEIAVLEEKLAKARRLKQGMMQELLTGRIRLV
jgi:type I restriction enzyme S subunit